jgi:hypothetical protein
MAPEPTIHRPASTDDGGPDAADRPAGADGPTECRIPPGTDGRAVTGPHPGDDRYGRYDHRFYRCERCGVESTAPDLCGGCPRCDDRERSGPGDSEAVGPRRSTDA